MKPRTTEELVRHILKRLQEVVDGRSNQWRTIMTNEISESAVELAVERGWLLVDGRGGACLTEAGRSALHKELS